MVSLLNALKKRYEGDIACAKANIQVYIEPVNCPNALSKIDAPWPLS